MRLRLSVPALAGVLLPVAALCVAQPAHAEHLDPIRSFRPPWLDTAAPPPPASAGAGQIRYRDATFCLAAAIAYEAGNQPLAGQQAVAEVVLNRLRSGRYGASVCAVVFQGAERRTGCQFSFTCDGALSRALAPRSWAVARAVAVRALEGVATARTDGATHYHSAAVSPSWQSGLLAVGRIGAHLFYRPARAGERVPLAPAVVLVRPAARPAPSGPWGLQLSFAQPGGPPGWSGRRQAGG